MESNVAILLLSPHLTRQDVNLSMSAASGSRSLQLKHRHGADGALEDDGGSDPGYGAWLLPAVHLLAGVSLLGTP